MKKIEILAPCVCAGRNVEPGVLLDPETIPANGLLILIGSGLAREVERYPVHRPTGSTSPSAPSKKAKK